MSSRKRARRQPPRPAAPRASRPPDEEVVVRVAGPAALVASLPAMLGFVPEESVVAIAMHRRGGRTRVGGMARGDLVAGAAPEERAAGAARRARAWVARVRAAARGARLARGAPDSLVLVVVAEAEPEREPGGR